MVKSKGLRLIALKELENPKFIFIEPFIPDLSRKMWKGEILKIAEVLGP